MRSFMILCLVTIAIAAPQYNYGQPGGHGFGSDSGIGSSIVGGGGSSGGSFASTHFGSIGSGSIGSGSIGSGHIGGHFGSTGGGHSGGGSTGFGSISGGGAGGGFRQVQTIYHKNVYIHSAPEEDLNDAASRGADLLSDRKNVNIIFIKTPDNAGLENAAINLAKSASEDKTAIYVLNKQTDIGELKNKVDQIQDSVATKPQVHFVKYKTAEEADYAQRTIQSSYDQLTGPTQVSNEGIAPVQNFVGSLGGQPSGVYANGKLSGHGTSYAPQQQYLPPSSSYLPA